MKENLLQVSELVTTFDTDAGKVRAIDGVSFNVPKGETVGVVGESGCGKSVTALSITRLLPRPMGQIESGKVLFNGRDLTKISLDDMHKVRGGDIGMVFQEPMTALNPVQTIGKQLAEILTLHNKDMSTEDALKKSVGLLEKVGIPAPDIRVGEYPHQLSGGMRQRVVIAIALACGPSLLIADEPTTALDVTIQAQILTLIKDLQRDMGMSVILITHDLGVIAETCDDVVVMYAGKVVESGTVFDIFDRPKHPYTIGLLKSIPRLDGERKVRLDTIEGMVPGLLDLPVGCRFQNRCPYKQDICEQASPPIEEAGPDHGVACYRWQEIEREEA